MHCMFLVLVKARKMLLIFYRSILACLGIIPKCYFLFFEGFRKH